MTPEWVVELSRRTIETALLIAAPILICTMVTGIAVSLFQAVTQINESTLTFLPKALAVALALVFFLPWMISIFVGFTTQLLSGFPLHLG